jgi:type IV pilus assembly protein PilC
MSPALANSPHSGFWKPRVTNKMHPGILNEDILAFFQQLSTLFRAGTPIHDAILMAADQTQSEKLKGIIRDIARQVAAGNELHAAMARHGDLFKTEWTEIIGSGEKSGQLETMLEKLAFQIDAAQQLQSKLISALIYPAIVLCVAIGALTVMLVKVVPTFADMFDAMGGELPQITQIVLQISEFLQEKGFYLVIGVTVLVVSIKRYIKTPAGRARFDKLQVSAPFIGEVTVQNYMQKYALNIALLLRAGLPILDAMRSLHGIYENTIYKTALARVIANIERGGGLADGMESTGMFTTFVVSMTRTGESSGQLPEVLDEVETFYRRKVETVAERLSKTLETVVILGMGVCVAVILCSVYLPMFSMAGGIS